jgi:two-component system chemotaxis response regulator CheB
MPPTQPSPAAGVRAVVCDDSPFMRRFLADALAAGGVEVVGSAADGDEALRACATLRPDVLTLDMQMPGRGGLDVLRALPAHGPRVVVVSAYTDEGSALALDALDAGAVEVILKPSLTTPLDAFSAGLAAAVASAAVARRPMPMQRRPVPPAFRAPSADLRLARDPQAPVRRVARPLPVRRDAPLVVLACSTGGPRALHTIMPALPARLGSGVLVVQHMPPGFTASLARRLDACSPLDVREARDRDRIEPGVALIAPGDRHLRVERGRVVLSDEPEIGGLRPRADVTLRDAAAAYGPHVLAVVLTGMGEDGLAGVRAVREAGGACIAEAEESCVVYGMPRAVVEAGLTDAVHPLDEIPAALAERVPA